MVKTKYQLNEGQQAALDWLVDFCLGKTKYRRALLKGYAGTGKTFTINRMVEGARDYDPGMNFGMTAPTHKAVRVLKKQSDLRDALDFGTIHSFLALKQDIDYRTGKVTYKPEFNSEYQRRIDGVDILIVDESSMLDDSLHEHIETELRSNGRLRVIYMGDERQIPPVGKKQKTGEANAIPFISEKQTAHQIRVLELTEPQRQAKESAIILYATAIREQHMRQKIDFTFPESKDHIEVLPADIGVLRDKLRTYFCGPEFQEDSDYVKCIAWRNTVVDYFNREIRLLVFKQDVLPRILDGERLIMDAPLIEGKKVIFSNNEEVITSNVRIHDDVVAYKLFPTNPLEEKQLEESGDSYFKKSLPIRVYECTLINEIGKSYVVRIIHEDSEKEFATLKENLATAAKRCADYYNKKELWKQFYKIGERFAEVKYNYCVTAHKAQGSSYDYCFSMEADIELNKDIEERNRIRYVAATRARHKLFIVR